MANKTIPQLPEQTGKTDDDLLVIVDSGETTTSKIKISTLLSGVGGSSPFIAADGTNNAVPDYYATSSIDSLSSESAIIGGTGNVMIGTHNESVIIGGNTNGFVNSSTNSTLIGGTTNIISTGTNNSIMGGNNNTIQNVNDSSIVGGWSNNISMSSSFISGQANIITGGARTCSGIVGSKNGNISGNFGFIGGGQNHIITESEGGILGGLACDVRGRWSVVAACDNSNVYGTFSLIGAGAAHNCTGSQSAIIGGQSNNNSHNFSVILGGNSQTTLQQNEVVVPKLRTTQYASLNFSGDTAAAAAGVQLGEFYHDNGVVRVRIT